MKKALLFFACLTLLFAHSYAQTDVTIPDLPDVKAVKTDVVIPDTSTSRWKVTGVTGLTGSQTYLSNWAAGGEDNMALSTYAKVNANYVKGRIAWGSALNAQYGRTWTEKYNTKNLDNFNLSSKFGVTSMNSKKLYWTALADFKTQFDKGYTNPDDPDSLYISKFFAPAYLNLALGADWKPLSWLSVFYSPLTGRLTFVQDDYLASQDLFGIGVDKKFHAVLGMYLKTEVNANLTKILAIKSTLDLFTPYDKTFGNIVVDWDLLLSAKLTQYISVTFNFGLKYDDRIQLKDKEGNLIGPRVQWKEMLGIGIAYNF